FVPNYDNFATALHPEDRNRVLEAVQQSVESALPFLEEYRIIRPDGSERVIHSIAKVDRDEQDRPVRMVGSAIDITQRKQDEAELLESEERFRFLAESLADTVYEFDSIGKFTYVNEAGVRILGYSKDELLGNIQARDTFSKEEHARSRKDIGEIFKGKTIIAERKFIRKDGTTFIGEIHSGPIYKGKDVIGVRGVLRDITARKEMEAHLQQSQKMEAIGTLAGGVAHQFNNALTGITGSLDLLELDLSDKVSVTSHIEQMRNASTRMVNLTNQLLAYARGGKYQAKIVSFSGFISDTLLLVAHKIKSSIYLETDLPHDILSVKADLTQMQMVISAIIINAAEAIEDKGRIRVTCRNEKITNETGEKFPKLKQGQYVRLTIEDDGCGMDEETRKYIFEPFFTTKIQGRGLGLAAAYGVLKNHDGLISVESELGKGTIVTIYLPGIKKLKMEKEEPVKELIKGTGTILLIEDEEEVMNVYRDLLERLGYHVLCAKTGQEAIYIAKTFDKDIDIAFLDIVLPDMGGGEIYPRLKKTRPKMKVIVCSGYSIDGPAQEILDAGAHSFIKKPFDLKMLSEKLSEVLEKN
ncbi:MAG: PAS domain S-box protein, partial [Desulfobacterales bacterium]|nr:PAS domain S-box protein [Desulfobacterales bacterium]